VIEDDSCPVPIVKMAGPEGPSGRQSSRRRRRATSRPAASTTHPTERRADNDALSRKRARGRSGPGDKAPLGLHGRGSVHSLCFDSSDEFPASGRLPLHRVNVQYRLRTSKAAGLQTAPSPSPVQAAAEKLPPAYSRQTAPKASHRRLCLGDGGRHIGWRCLRRLPPAALFSTANGVLAFLLASRFSTLTIFD
jgi:hypothetical protein